MTTTEIANINYLVIILIMNLIAGVFFYFSPARHIVELKPSVNNFMIMFGLIAAAFFMFVTRTFIPLWVSLSFTNFLFVLSAYFAKRSFLYRTGNLPPELLKDQIIWINLVLLTFVNTGLFYFVYENFAVRASITSINVAAIFYSCISIIPKDKSQITDGERIAIIAVYSTVIFTPLSAVFHWIDQSFFIYMSTLMFTQAIAVTALSGGFLSLLTSDLIQEHYKRSVIDPLTGVYNRRFFDEKAEKILGFSLKSDSTHAIIVTDIDDFKTINDLHGHAAGDEVLVAFSKIISDTVRNSDVVSRFGGEEFVILLPSATKEEAQKLAERLCTAISALTITTQAGNLNITASFGVSTLNTPTNLPICLNEADSAMYEAKKAGKNCVVAFS